MAAGLPSPTLEKRERLGGIVETPAPAVAAGGDGVSEKQRTTTRDGEAATGDDDDMNARETLAGLRKIAPPRKRFLEVKNAGELRISEVEELLQEYRRLAKAIGEAVAS